jgi:hypothetical protein
MLRSPGEVVNARRAQPGAPAADTWTLERHPRHPHLAPPRVRQRFRGKIAPMPRAAHRGHGAHAAAHPAMRRTSVYRTWRAKTVACPGLTGDFDRVRWETVAGTSTSAIPTHRSGRAAREIGAGLGDFGLQLLRYDAAEMRTARDLLKSGGHLLVIVPAHPCLFSPIDERLRHYRRYDRASSLRLVETVSGFEAVECRYINKLGVAGWLFNQWRGTAHQSRFLFSVLTGTSCL